MQSQIKVIYKNETKKFRKPADYDGLHQQTVKAFGSTLPKNFKFFYQDPEGDLISISCQEDLEEAYSSMSQLRLIVESSIQEARNLLEPDFSVRSSSLNIPMQMQPSPINPLSQGVYIQQSGTNIFDQFHHQDSQSVLNKTGQDFEEISKLEEQKSLSVNGLPEPSLSFKGASLHSVAIGGEDEIVKLNNAETSTQMIDHQNIGCNTQIQTDEKQLNAVVDTKDIGSQFHHDVKEVSCGGSIQTESKGSQFKSEGVSQEINCQILRPENNEEQISDDEGFVCFKCDGTKINKKGIPCRKCNGTGVLKNKFYTDLVKVLKEEVKAYTTQTFQRLMVDYLGKKASDQAGVVHHNVTCDGCHIKPIQGIRYKCSVCGDFDFCENCEAQKPHDHPFVKIRNPKSAPAFIQCEYKSKASQMSCSQSSYSSQSQPSRRITNKKSQEIFVKHQARFVTESFNDRFPVQPGQFFTKTWTFRNGGDVEWPADTRFIQTNGDDLCAQISPVPQNVLPNHEVTVLVSMKAPTEPGNYIAFFRFAHGDNQRFGQKVWCDILVQKSIFSPALPVVVPQVPEIINQAEPKEERSSLLNESMMQSSFQIAEPAQPELKFELINPIQVPEVQPEPVVIEQPVQQVPQVEEVSALADPVQEQPAAQELQKSQLSREEFEKMEYLTKLEQIKEPEYVDNLKYMLELGYTSYEVNYNLLKRNKNDLVVAINMLCNQQVSDSMFQQ